ncbi:unnamed protein product [Cuscuta campestris]|uniref:CCHC-type domain-containing protein n=1 Tax=Cuscuta campestris TaxID=132261 RepID=A0A484M625_9ASTE|nr:unnamed protein product [Cuscuta campestris]
MVNNMDHGLPKFSLLGYDDWKIMMEAHLYALHDCMWMVLEDGPLKIQMENPERNPESPDVVQYIPKPKEKWDDRDCKKHNLDNVAKAAIFNTLDPITFSKIKHLKTAMEIWQGLGKLCEGSEDLRKQKIKVLLEKFKGFKMLPRESFDMLDERFHKILNDLASLNHVLSPKEKNVRLLRSLPTEWYTKATAIEEGRNLENYTVQGLLDELRTYEHELKKKKEEQVTPFPTALMTTPRVPTSEGTCPRSCDTPSSSQPSNSKMENYDEEFVMMVKQFRKFKKFFKKADSVTRPSKGKPQVSDSPPESYLCYNCRKPGHWKSACPYPKVEKYGERERNEKKKKAMVAAESDDSSSSSSDEEALVCMERRVEKSNHEDRWTMSEDDHLCLMAKDDAEQEVTSQASCSSSYESIPTSENLFDQFKKMMVDFEEINLKHSSLTEENKLLSEENLKLTEGRKSQLDEITQLKTENESLSEKVKSLNKELGILKSKEAVDKLLETTNNKGRKGLGFDPSSSKRKGRTTFIPPKPTAKPNKQKVKEKEKPTEVPKKEATKYPGVWYLDSGCSRHMTGDASLLRNLIPYDGPRVTFGGSNDFGLTKGLGNLVYKGLTIQDVSYVEGLNYNLLSISQFCDKGYSLEFCKDMASLKNISTNEVILTGKRIRNIYEVMWDNVKEACLISKGAQELTEFLQMEIRLKYEEEVLEFYRNGEVKTAKSKKDPQRTFPVIKSTVGGIKVKLSQKNLGEKLRLPNSGVEVGKLPAKNLDWNVIGNSGQIPSGQAKKADLNNDYKLVLELVIACLECGSGVKGKKYETRYWLYYLSSKGENRASASATAEESSSDNLPLIQLAKTAKRKQVVSPSPSIEAPQNLALACLEEEDEVSDHGELQRKKKRKINSPSISGNVNPEELKEKENVEESSAQNRSPQQLEEEIPQDQSLSTSSSQPQTDDAENKFWQLYFHWKAWKVGNSADQLLDWDQQLKNEQIIKKCLGIPVNHNCEQILDDYWVWQRNSEDLHMEYLASTPVSDYEADDEDTAVFKPVFANATEEQKILTAEEIADLEATAEDFPIFPETSPASKMVLTGEKAASPPQEQNQEPAAEEESQQLIQPQVLEILTTPCEISNQPEPEIPDKSTEIPEQSGQDVEVQRHSEEADKATQMEEVEVSQTPAAIFEEQNAHEDSDSLSRYISNFVLEGAEGKSERKMKVTDEEDEQEDAESLPLQLFQRTSTSHHVTNFHFHSSTTSTLPDEIPEVWTKKVQGLIKSALASQHATFRQEIEQMEAKYRELLEKSEEKHSADLREISKSVDKTLEIISLLSKTVSNTMEVYTSDSQLQFNEFNKVKEHIASVTVNLQKQMSLLQMDIRAALAVASANQVVIKDYLKVIIDNQKEAYKLFRLLGAKSGNRKMEVILQQHSPSPIPPLPIAVNEGEASYIPSHLNMTNLILGAQQRNPENSAQHLSSAGLDETEFVGAVADHFSDDAQAEERRENLRRIKELCGNMQGISEVAGSSKSKRN